SHTAPGYLVDKILDIPVSGEEVPDSLQHIDLSISIAGRRIRERYPPLPNLTHRFAWDGRDAYGRFLPGNTLATIEITYQYPLAYYAARSDFDRSFAQFGRSSGGRVQIIGQRRRVQPVGLRRTYRRIVRASPGPHHGLGGWTPSIYHRYQPSTDTLWLGNGAMRRGVKALSRRASHALLMRSTWFHLRVLIMASQPSNGVRQQ
ncbi:MAG: hypothetical protein MJE77_17420, partial [Proteobacteria bacterium]|nr:hypothetical protein [Pseudomonadota bacterium]